MKRYQHSTERQLNDNEQLLPNDNTIAKNDHSEITFSVVELKLPGSDRKSSESVSNQSSEESSESNDETASLISAK